MSTNHEYRSLFAAGRRAGKSPEEIARAWRAANHRIYGNPSSPESQHHHARRKTVGTFLSRGYSIREALRMAEGRTERSRRRPARNPDLKPILLVGGVLAGLLWLSRRGA